MSSLLEKSQPQPPAVDALSVVPATSDDAAPCREYLDRHPQGSIYHDPVWDQVFAVYRLPACRLVARRGKQIVGLLPLVDQRVWGWEHQVVSLPWFDAAGLLADDPAVSQALIAAALDWARRRGTQRLHLRQMQPTEAWPGLRTDKALMRLRLEADPDALWKRFSAKVRNQVRKAQKSGLVVETGGVEFLPGFYATYSHNMRDLGSPAHSQAFFAQVMQAFPGAARLHRVLLEGQVIGCALTLANGKRLEVPWASSLRSHNSLCVNHALYWHLLEDACREGFEWFHFGRSTKGSGTFHFKQQWGAEPCQLYWYYWGRPAPDPQRAPAAEELALASRIWRRLPLWLTRRAGPHLIARLS